MDGFDGEKHSDWATVFLIEPERKPSRRKGTTSIE